MRIGILVPMAAEIKTYQKQLLAVKTSKIAGVVFSQGKLRDQEVDLVVAQSGIGKVQAAMTATLLCGHFDVDVLLNTGSAAGVDSDLQIGELVLGEQVTAHDVDVHQSGGYPRGQLPGQPRFFKADQTLLSICARTAQQLGLTMTTGLIASGDQFIGTTGEIKTVKHFFPRVQALEMEGAAVAQVAANFDCPCLIIRAISDNGDETAAVDFDTFVVKAGRQAATLLLAAIPAISASFNHRN